MQSKPFSVGVRIEHLKKDIDIERARRALERAKNYLDSNDPTVDKDRALKALIRAEARISLWENK